MVRSSARCQFILEVDELVFEAFAPQRLKDAMDEAAVLELPPLRPTLMGLELAPLLKLSAAAVMLGYLLPRPSARRR